ncbi:MAG TPA: ATP-binding protein [Nitrospirae bacterium]|nr:ATP-binding protein [Nitrospirota bacterium]
MNSTVDIHFSLENLNAVFKTSPKHPDRLISREGNRLEFKEKFGFSSLSKYAKTMAAFSNAQGGYIVFGIKDSPHKMIGIDEEYFNRIDPEKLTQGLNDIFSPEIDWEMHVHEFQGKTFGLIYVCESGNKPIVAKKNFGEIRESEIYYRYRGRSEKVKYPELMHILDERRKQEQQRWMSHLERIARIGVENVGVLDINTGKVTGPCGSLIIDESMLNDMSFIKEGQFVQKDGTPATKVVGNVQPVASGSILPVRKVYKTKTRGIRSDDIIRCFLNQETVDNPIEYVKQICWESSSNLPVYYYIHLSGIPLAKVIYELEEIRTRSPSQNRLIKRLNSPKDYTLRIPNAETRAAERKRDFRKRVLKRHIKPSTLPQDPVEARYLIQSIQTLKQQELNVGYVMNLLKAFYQSYFTDRNNNLAGNIRAAICHIDTILYLDRIAMNGGN